MNSIPVYNIHNEKGSATILTLLVSAVMITVGIGFNWIVKEHLKAAEGLKIKTEAMVEARSTFGTLIYSILNSTKTQKEIRLSGSKLLGVDAIPIGSAGIQLGNNIAVKVQDSHSLVSIVSINTDVFKRLVNIAGGEGYKSDSIGDVFIDWIDADDLSRVNGAESMYYRYEDKPYAPRNFIMQYADEVGFLKGMKPEIYKRLEPHLTILPSFGFNPNTADNEVLMAFLDIDRKTSEKLKDYIEKNPITKDTELVAITGKGMMTQYGEGVYYYPSPYLKITVKAGSPRSVYIMEIGVDTRQNMTSPFSVIYWKEG